MQLDRFTTKSQEAIQAAISLAAARRHTEVQPEHLLAVLLEQPEGVIPGVLRKLGTSPDEIRRIVNEALDAGWTVAVASTSAEESVRAVLEHAVGAGTASRVPVFAGDVVPAKKPDPAIYELTLERLGGGLSPAQRLFVDDVAHNVATAQRLGMTAIQFRSNEQAIGEIRAAIDGERGST